MFGNTNQPVDVMVQTGHLFAPMPDIIRDDMAFIDRMHFYLPGWEIPKMRNELFTDHYGFVVDYLARSLTFYENDHHQHEEPAGWAARHTKGVSEGPVRTIAIERREPLRVELEAFAEAVRNLSLIHI